MQIKDIPYDTVIDEKGRNLKLIKESELSLDTWLQLMSENVEDFYFKDCSFPSEEHLQEYIRTVDKRSDREIKDLLRKFLIPSTSLKCDDHIYKYINYQKENDKEGFNHQLEFEFTKRLILWRLSKGITSPPWEGITWVFDLLPHFPKQAISSLQAYLMAHAGILPDGRIDGLTDACQVIRAKYIGIPETQAQKVEELYSLSSREFEYLTEKTFKEMGYITELTPAKFDGGRDIVATRNEPGKKEKILIECKLYKGKVGVETIRALLGVVSDEKSNKGILVSTGSFTKGALTFAKRNPKIELISGGQLVLLMNEHIGPTWPGRLEKIIAECMMRESKSEKKSPSN